MIDQVMQKLSYAIAFALLLTGISLTGCGTGAYNEKLDAAVQKAKSTPLPKEESDEEESYAEETSEEDEFDDDNTDDGDFEDDPDADMEEDNTDEGDEDEENPFDE